MNGENAICVLYMEDDDGLARLFQKRLSRLGYEVDVARNGEHGLEMLKSAQYDLLVVDHQMPVKTGLEVIRKLSSHKDGPPIIMLTGAGSESIAVEAMKLGASDYVIKDVDNRYLELIPLVLEKALKNHELAEAKRYAEEELRKTNDELEIRVRERTTALADANECLKEEIIVRAAAEDEVRRQIEFLHNVLESLTHPFYVIDAETYEITVANRASRLNFASEKSTCHALTHGRAAPCRGDKHPCPLQTVISAGAPASVEHVHVGENGEDRYVEINSYPIFDEQGAVSQVIEYCLDITDRKRAEEALRESEERFRTIIDSAGDCIFIKDNELRYTFVNPTMTDLFKMPSSSFLGKTDVEIFGKEAGKRLRQVDMRVLKGERIEEEHTLQVGSERLTFLDTRVPVLKAGHIEGVCGISRNITDRKQNDSVSLVGAGEFESESMRKTLSLVQLAARKDITALLTGESGVGKDYLARRIHDQSPRSGGPFFTINCAAVSSQLAESELFGHEAGSFTGATRKKRGLLELAEGGTLLLNEIGELSLRLQSKLLTFLDTRSFTRIGGETPIHVSARLIAATNRDLEKEVAEGGFRKDLYYRLNVFTIEVPPLRERRLDIPILIERILSQLAAEMRLSATPKVQASFLDGLCRYDWPGNVRELRNILERAVILSNGRPLNMNLPEFSCETEEDWGWTAQFPPRTSLNETVKDLKRSFIEHALKRTDGKKSEAARLLGVTYDALKKQLKTLGISV